MDIPEDDEITDHSSLDNEIARADNDDIHKVAAEPTVPELMHELKQDQGLAMMKAPKHDPRYERQMKQREYEDKLAWEKRMIADGLLPKYDRDASLKTAADDLNPLQEPIQEKPTSSVALQDIVPMGEIL